MKSPAIDEPRHDRKGILIASLCFVHCVLGPVLLSFAGMTSLINISERLEPLFLLGSAAMGAVALVPGYRKRHRRVSCLAMFGTGLLCLLLRRQIDWEAIPLEPAAVCLGAALIIGAHALNLKFSKRCTCCETVNAQRAGRTGYFNSATGIVNSAVFTIPIRWNCTQRR
jgi:hypothetical protein